MTESNNQNQNSLEAAVGNDRNIQPEQQTQTNSSKPAEETPEQHDQKLVNLNAQLHSIPITQNLEELNRQTEERLRDLDNPEDFFRNQQETLIPEAHRQKAKTTPVSNIDPQPAIENSSRESVPPQNNPVIVDGPIPSEDLKRKIREKTEKAKKDSIQDVVEHLKKETEAGKVVLYIDGASKGNPGPSGIGCVIQVDGDTILEAKEYIGEATCNEAEYKALLKGLELVKERNLKLHSIYSDSELMVKQIHGNYNVKSPNLYTLWEKSLLSLKSFSDTLPRIHHIPREQNQVADRLANEAIEEHQHNVAAKEDVKKPIFFQKSEESSLDALKKYILEDGFVVETVAMQLTMLCGTPLVCPSFNTWRYDNRSSIPKKVFDLLYIPGYLESIWPSLKVVMADNIGNVDWTARIATTFCFFDVIKILPNL